MDGDRDHAAGEVLPPVSAVERAAALLHFELERMFPSDEGSWDDISEGHRQAILEIIERLLQSWPLLMQAHVEMLTPSQLLSW